MARRLPGGYDSWESYNRSRVRKGAELGFLPGQSLGHPRKGEVKVSEVRKLREARTPVPQIWPFYLHSLTNPPDPRPPIPPGHLSYFAGGEERDRTQVECLRHAVSIGAGPNFCAIVRVGLGPRGKAPDRWALYFFTTS